MENGDIPSTEPNGSGDDQLGRSRIEFSRFLDFD